MPKTPLDAKIASIACIKIDANHTAPMAYQKSMQKPPPVASIDLDAIGAADRE
jgi:hypothetical protein